MQDGDAMAHPHYVRSRPQHLDALEVGGTVDMRGPVVEFGNHGNGKFLKEHEECHSTHFNMIAGGTRMTPVMQISAEIVRNVSDNTRAHRG